MGKILKSFAYDLTTARGFSTSGLGATPALGRGDLRASFGLSEARTSKPPSPWACAQVSPFGRTCGQCACQPRLRLLGRDAVGRETNGRVVGAKKIAWHVNPTVLGQVGDFSSPLPPRKGGMGGAISRPSGTSHQTHQMGTVGVVHTSLSGVKSYD